MNKIGVIADIHSNAYALEAVIDDLEKRGVSDIINLGDVFYGPIAPKKTWEILKPLNWTTIQGNQDRYLYEDFSETRASNPTLSFVLDEIGESALSWIRNLPKTSTFDNGIFVCHGTPESDTTYLLEDISTGAATLRSDKAIRGFLTDVQADVVLCAHSHIAHSIQLSDNTLVINPGSIGLPAYADEQPIPHKMEAGSSHARYAILEKTVEGWHVEHIHTAYDHSRAAKTAEQNGRPDWAHAIQTGRVK